MLSSLIVGALLGASFTAAAPSKRQAPAPNTFVVSNSGGNVTSPYQYGIMFEDINHSIDGGLYAELIQNRAFQAANWSAAEIAPWYALGGAALSLDNGTSLSAALPYSITVGANGASGQVGIANPGYYGLEVIPQVYSGSFYMRGTYKGSLTVALQSNSTTSATVFASTTIPVTSEKGVWQQITYQLTPPAAAPSINNSLAITFDAATATDGSLNFNLISLFPPTYNDRPNGMRIDLMNTLAGLTPSFLRWGGNNNEGIGPAESSPRWIWNNTIGPLTDRPGRLGAWGYYNTDGVGLAEVFNWAEDLDMDVILTLWDGHYLDGTVITGDALQPYIDEALNELEYILGDSSTTYGAMRSANGNEDPWKLNFVEIGNEDNLSEGEATYQERFTAFYNAVSTAYPNLTIIASTTLVDLPDGAIGDYHDYNIPDIFVSEYNLFDQQTVPNKTFIGEYAAVTNNGLSAVNYSALNPAPWWIGTVSEAVFLLGAERNAATMYGASYAPSFRNIDQPIPNWSVDLIEYTAASNSDVRSTSYHMVDLFSGTRMTTTRPVDTIENSGPLYWVAGENTPVGMYIFKAAVYNSTGDVPVTVQFEGLGAGVQANLTVLTGISAYAANGVGLPEAVITNVTTLTSTDSGFTFTLPDLSVALLATFPNNAQSTFEDWLTGFSGIGGYGGCKNGRTIVPSWGNGC